MKKNYMKLVRDNIPDIMKADGCMNIQTQRLEYTDYSKALSLKLKEEAMEAADEVLNGNREKMMEELADLEEVVLAIKKHFQISTDEIENKRKEKKQIKGGFEKRIWLETAED